MGEITTEAGKVLIEAFTAKPSEPDFAIRISESSVIRHAVPLSEAEAVAAERERIVSTPPWTEERVKHLLDALDGIARQLTSIEYHVRTRR